MFLQSAEKIMYVIDVGSLNIHFLLKAFHFRASALYKKLIQWCCWVNSRSEKVNNKMVKLCIYVETTV